MKRIIEGYLKKYGLLELMDFVFSSEDTSCCKNDFLFWEKLIVAESLVAEDCLVVGDNKLEDIEISAKFGFPGF
jgi:FMN phosphatase YigB (HAD superfamily)